MNRQKIAKELVKIARAIKSAKIAKEEFLPELEDFDEFARKMTDAQKAYGDEFNGDKRFTPADQRRLSEMRDLNWRGKYKSSNAFVVELRKAIYQYNDFHTDKMVDVAKKFKKYKYCLARENSVCIYIKGFKKVEEVAELTKELLKIKADEISLEKNGTIIWAEWSDKIYGLDSLVDEDLKDFELRVWWD